MGKAQESFAARGADYDNVVISQGTHATVFAIR
jgi:hypothetical protein